MIPAAFDYHSPQTLEDALALLQSHRDDVKVLSGGQSLLPLLKLRLGAAGHLVDIGRIPGLEYIKEEGGVLKIGGRTRESALEHSELIQTKYPLLAETAAVIADPLVRNLATVGGNLAHGDPANDHPATMLALRAEVVATGPNGTRTIPINQFFLGLFMTALEPDEILTEIRIPVPPAPPLRTGGAYVKLERKVGDFATAASAVQLTLGAGGEVTAVGIGLTNAGPTPLRAIDAEQYLTGKQSSDDVIAEAARRASVIASPSADRRGAIEYKRQMARVLTARALKRAIQWAREH
jgi:aerobic carbon-monoxide dehydrogenase medium subunit